MEMSHYAKMKKDFVVQFEKEQITALSAAVVTQKLQQMSSGFIYNTETTASDTPGRMNVTQVPIWFSTHKFDLLDELLEENQHANTIIVYNYIEELAELNVGIHTPKPSMTQRLLSVGTKARLNYYLFTLSQQGMG